MREHYDLLYISMGPLDWDLGSTSENKYKISSCSIGLLPFSEALPKIPSKKDLEEAEVPRGGSTVVVKWRKKTSEELCYITFFFPIKLHLGQSDHNIRFISKHQS